MPMGNMISVGILLFNEVEVLDFAGPFEVFSLAEKNREKLFRVLTIGENGEMIHARNGLKVMPELNFATCPDLDILIIPGGYGAEHLEIKNQVVIDWIRDQQQKVKILASVCTGALLLAATGLLNGKKATTHRMDIDRLEQEFPSVNVVRNVKYVDEGNIISSGGISAGISMSFHIVKRFAGIEVARQTAKRMEYEINIE